MGGVKSISLPGRNEQLILTNALLNISTNNGKKLLKNASKEIFELVHSKRSDYWYIEKQNAKLVAVLYVRQSKNCLNFYAQLQSFTTVIHPSISNGFIEVVTCIEHTDQCALFFKTNYLRLTEEMQLFTKEFYKIIYQEPHHYIHKLTTVLKICGSSLNSDAPILNRNCYFLWEKSTFWYHVAFTTKYHFSFILFLFLTSDDQSTLNSRGRLFILLTSTARSLH